ncbi:glycine--tRNA ligase subunit alpha [Proteinivorax hydrogeniformans]|uniref:glycine--tRNA ligase n=1 Tax=Proteinivorax hydrogeniformans TaxID=1826727 RepID=A0AAU8HWR4_9FIRM
MINLSHNLEQVFHNQGFQRQPQYNEERSSYLLHPQLFFNIPNQKTYSLYHFDSLINKWELNHGPKNHELITRTSFTSITSFSTFDFSPCRFYKQCLEEIGLKIKASNLLFNPTDLSQPVIGVHSHGWEVVLNGRYIGEVAIIDKLGGTSVSPGLAFYFDLSSLHVLLGETPSPSYQTDRELTMYLHKHSSKDMLYDLFDIYLSEASYALKNKLRYTAFNFLVKSILVYEFLIIRGTVSITEKIGYNKKFTELLQACIQE